MDNPLERDSAVPLYQQLEEIFTAKIKRGEWKPQQRIPSENELNRIYSLSRMTVRGVLTKMVNDGLLHRVPGMGTYVAPSTKINAISPAYRGVREQLEAMGYAITTKLLSSEVVSPSTEVQANLNIGADEQVYEIIRLRSADGLPISLHRSYIPAGLAPDLTSHDVVNEQLCVVLEDNYGLRMRKVSEHLEAVALEAADAKQLAIRKGEPALLLQDVIFNDTLRPFEYSKIVFRGDKLRLRFDYDL